jgi:hypothetical protein
MRSSEFGVRNRAGEGLVTSTPTSLVVVGILLPRKNIKGAIGPKILVSAFSPQPSAFILRALAVPAFFPNSHLPSAISQ